MIEIVQADDTRFPSLLCKLVQQTQSNPIYCPSFKNYYRLASLGTEHEDLSAVGLVNGEPVVGFVGVVREESTTKGIDYFGHPAAFFAVDSAASVSGGIRELALWLSSKGLKKQYFGNEGWSFSIALPPAWLRYPERLISEILYRSSAIRPRFERVFDMKVDAGMLDDSSSWPKSVREALKRATTSSVESGTVDYQSRSHEIDEAFQAFKVLHYASAGRLTRPTASWDEQKLKISEGSAFLSFAKLESTIIGASYFMSCGQLGFYGVSAVSKIYKELSLGHLIMVEALTHASKASFSKVWIGTQLSEKSATSTDKEQGIEKFKSYFGSELNLSISAER
jgi:hypothetical protein